MLPFQLPPPAGPARLARPWFVRTALAAGVVAGGLALSAQAADAAPTVKVKHRTLTLKGDAASNRLALRVDPARPGKLEVDLNDDGTADFRVPRNTFNRIVVKGGGGDDRIRIDESGLVFTTTIPTRIEGQGGNDTLLGGSGAERLNGGSGADVVDGNGGNDVSNLGAGDDRFIWDSGDGSDVVKGRKGADALVFNGSAGDENFRLSPDGRRARLIRDVGNITMGLNGIERVDVNSLDGKDAFTVDDLAATDVRTVNHDEAATLGGSDPDTGADQTIVNATNRAEAIAAAGRGGSASVTGLAAAVNIAHAEGTRDTLVVNALGGEDSVTASPAADTLRMTTDGGAGNDTLTGGEGVDTQIGGDGNDTIDGRRGDDLAFMGPGDDRFRWDPGDGSDTVEGQAGRDAMTFNGANIAEQFDVSANGSRVRFFRNVANITMDIDGVEQVDANAIGGADALTVGDLSGTDLTGLKADLAGTLGGGAGDGAADTVIVNATNGDDVITAAGSAGNVSVSGLHTRVDVAHAEAANDVLAINALAGNDIVEGSGLRADAIRFRADGGDGEDVLIGGFGNDTLLGGAGDDVLQGGPGQDVLDGGPGNNIVIQD